GGATYGYTNTGGRYNPSTDTWSPTTTSNAPAARVDHSAVWIGTGMFVWGGGAAPGSVDTGAIYNPSNNTWTTSTTTNAPAGRSRPTAVWTGSEMIVWGGYSYNGTYTYWTTGGRYNPGTGSWTSLNTVNAPAGRVSHTAIWSGAEMMIWGGGSTNDWIAGG